jgi:hypothetical protein
MPLDWPSEHAGTAIQQLGSFPAFMLGAVVIDICFDFLN